MALVQFQFKVKVKDVRRGGSVALVIGNHTLPMSPPSPTEGRWSVCVAVPSGEHKYNYAITTPDGQIRRDDNGNDGMPMYPPERVERIDPDGEHGALHIIVDSFGKYGGKWVIVTPSHQASQAPFSSLNAIQSPTPFTALPTTHGQMTTLPNTVKIHASTHERPITIGFTDAASEATRRLCIGVACEEMTASAARHLFCQGADAKATVTVDGHRRALVQLLAKYHRAAVCAAGVLRVLLDAGAGRDADNLQYCLEKDRWDLIEVLLEPQCNWAGVVGVSLLRELAVADDQYLTPAARLRMTKAAGDRDASVLTEEDDSGMQPIHCFCQHPLRDSQCQELLIDYFVAKVGPDVVNTPDEDGERPLWYAYIDLSDGGGRDEEWEGEGEGVDEATVDRLCHHGAAQHINTPNSDGRTLLKAVAQSLAGTDTEVLVNLLEHGASLAAADAWPGAVQRAPLQTAKHRGWDDMESDSSGGGLSEPDVVVSTPTWKRVVPTPSWKRLLVDAYRSFLNVSVPRMAMRTINDALRPSRSLTASLTRTIPLRTNSITLPVDVLTTVGQFMHHRPHIHIGDQPVGDRTNRTVDQYVREAKRMIMTQEDGNARLLGGHGRPPLRCFAVRGEADRCMGICEMLYRAVRAEATRWDIRVTIQRPHSSDDEILENFAIVKRDTARQQAGEKAMEAGMAP
ncbi:unnamed protein product [Vitrella brassicaformis CCMP3155]|uniref:Uncharacterized protein n=1 Tax=Vitrella brassicaformis (strain CCMP3155) TaxID=1169540 RepID=A0A0G4FF26_VITBC|nr:unnamed protein product [Vitrella brassicaformis CCMP3155]|eukprot:CEM11801.1 unnamed protein product [Vitrella brassicaformis CCMP3155]